MEILDFAHDSTHWRYTTAADVVTYAGNAFSPQAGSKVGPIRIARNALRSVVEIDLPWSCPMIKEFLAGRPDGEISLIYYRGHEGLFRPFWRGWVKAVRWMTERKARVQCIPMFSDLGTRGLALRCGRLCQVPLYSSLCGLTKADWQVSSIASSVSGVTVTSQIFGDEADGYWVGGPFEAAGVGRTILAHTGDTVTIDMAIPDLADGMPFTAAPGCDHLYAGDCTTVFDNGDNNRGQPHIPDVNPFKQGTN